MAEEWYTSPQEAARRLELLSGYWNALRNAALGRSTRPRVSADLADTIAADHLSYHEWRDALPEGFVYGVPTWVDELQDWTSRANWTHDQIKRELPGEQLPARLTEWKPTLNAHDAMQAGKGIVIAQMFSGLGGLLMGAGFIYFLARRGR